MERIDWTRDPGDDAAGRLAGLRCVFLLGLGLYAPLAALASWQEAAYGRGLETMAGLGVPALVLGSAVLLAHRRNLMAQLSARAIVWFLSMVVAALHIQVFTWGAPGGTGWVLLGVATLGCLGSLVFLGRGPLRARGRSGSPPYRRWLRLGIVMGLADAMLLVLLGTRGFTELGAVPLFIGLAAWLAFAAVGLYRERVWGLAAMAAGNLVEAWIVLDGSHNLVEGVAAVLLVTAVAQLLVPLPLYRALARRGGGYQGDSENTPLSSRRTSTTALVPSRLS